MRPHPPLPSSMMVSLGWLHLFTYVPIKSGVNAEGQVADLG